MNQPIPKRMRAMLLREIAPLSVNDTPLEPIEMETPAPAPGEILVRVTVCGVCHTELDEIEGRTSPSFLPIIPGHQVVGRVVKLGDGVDNHKLDDRVGIGWIYCSCGGERENISEEFRATGRDAHGGYADFMVVPAGYAYLIPEVFTDQEAAPMLCAGGVGYRALQLTSLKNGEPLGLTGFGASGHLVLQLARHMFPASKVIVFARSAAQRQFAMELGADWAGDISEEPPFRPQAIIDTTPAWQPVLGSLEQLRPGGRLVINAIRKEDQDVEALTKIDYGRHLWMEKEVKTVANVRAQDIREFLSLAALARLKPGIRSYPLEQANAAIRSLRRGDLRGSLILEML